jgi:hypothetical protein
MTRRQIVAELRRSALCDNYPWVMVAYDAYRAVQDWECPCEYERYMWDKLVSRMFFLFVAEALAARPGEKG